MWENNRADALSGRDRELEAKAKRLDAVVELCEERLGRDAGETLSDYNAGHTDAMVEIRNLAKGRDVT